MAAPKAKILEKQPSFQSRTSDILNKFFPSFSVFDIVSPKRQAMRRARLENGPVAHSQPNAAASEDRRCFAT